MSVTFGTHCPSDRAGTLAPLQFTPNHVGSATVTTVDATGGQGNRRGVLCFLHPSAASDRKMPFVINNFIGESYVGMQQAANNDGWVFDYPAYPADWSINGVSHFGSFYYAVQADPTFGTEVIGAYVAWWDHYESYVADRFGSNVPIVLGGFSMGAWAAATIALNATTVNLVGVFMHGLPTLWENVSSAFTGYTMSAVTWTAVDFGAHAFDSLAVPAIIGYSETDGILGWNASGSPNGTPVANNDDIITNAQAAGQPMTRYRSYDAAGDGLPWDESGTGPPRNVGHLFLPNDGVTYCSSTGTGNPNTTPALSQGWIQQVVDPGVPVNTF